MTGAFTNRVDLNQRVFCRILSLSGALTIEEVDGNYGGGKTVVFSLSNVMKYFIVSRYFLELVFVDELVPTCCAILNPDNVMTAVTMSNCVDDTAHCMAP